MLVWHGENICWRIPPIRSRPWCFSPTPATACVPATRHRCVPVLHCLGKHVHPYPQTPIEYKIGRVKRGCVEDPGQSAYHRNSARRPDTHCLDNGRVQDRMHRLISSLLSVLAVHMVAADVSFAQIAATVGPGTDSSDVVTFPRAEIERLLTEEFSERIHELSNKDLAALFEKLLSSEGRNVPKMLLELSPSTSPTPGGNNSFTTASKDVSSSVIGPSQKPPERLELSSKNQSSPAPFDATISSSLTAAAPGSQPEEADSDVTSQLLNGFLTQQLDSAARPLDTTSSFLNSFLSNGRDTNSTSPDDTALSGINSVEVSKAVSESAEPTLQEKAAELALKAGSAALDATAAVGKVVGQAAWDAVTHAIESAQEAAQNAEQHSEVAGSTVVKSTTQFMGQLPGEIGGNQVASADNSWLPSLPSLPSLPPLPSLPAAPSLPQLPSVSLPSMPTLPSGLPSLPFIPSMPPLPQIPGLSSTVTAPDSNTPLPDSNPSKPLASDSMSSPSSSPSPSPPASTAAAFSTSSGPDTPSDSATQPLPLTPQTQQQSPTTSSSDPGQPTGNRASASVPPTSATSGSSSDMFKAPIIGANQSPALAAPTGPMDVAAQLMSAPNKLVEGVKDTFKGLESAVHDVQDVVSSTQDALMDPDMQEQAGKFATAAGFLAAIAGGYILIDTVAPAEPSSEQQQQNSGNNTSSATSVSGDGKPRTPGADSLSAGDASARQDSKPEDFQAVGTSTASTSSTGISNAAPQTAFPTAGPPRASSEKPAVVGALANLMPASSSAVNESFSSVAPPVTASTAGRVDASQPPAASSAPPVSRSDASSSTSSAFSLLPAFLFSPFQLLLTPLLASQATPPDSQTRPSSPLTKPPADLREASPTSAAPVVLNNESSAAAGTQRAAIGMQTTSTQGLDNQLAAKSRPMLLDNVQTGPVLTPVPAPLANLPAAAPSASATNTSATSPLSRPGAVLWDRDINTASTVPGAAAGPQSQTEREAYQSMLSALSSGMTPEELRAFAAASSVSPSPSLSSGPSGPVLWQRGDEVDAVNVAVRSDAGEAVKNAVLWERSDMEPGVTAAPSPSVTLWQRDDNLPAAEGGAMPAGAGVVLWQYTEETEAANTLPGSSSSGSDSAWSVAQPANVGSGPAQITSAITDSTSLKPSSPSRLKTRRARTGQVGGGARGSLSRVLDNVDEVGLAMEFATPVLPAVVPPQSWGTRDGAAKYSVGGVQVQIPTGQAGLGQKGQGMGTEHAAKEGRQFGADDPWKRERGVDAGTRSSGGRGSRQEDSVSSLLGDAALDYMYPARHWLESSSLGSNSPWEA